MATYKIGRADDNHVVLADKSVSRHHAELDELGAGRFRLRDIGSSAGTQILSGSEWVDVKDTEIRHDTRIRFGEYETSPMELLRDQDKTVVHAKPAAPPAPPSAPHPEAAPPVPPPAAPPPRPTPPVPPPAAAAPPAAPPPPPRPPVAPRPAPPPRPAPAVAPAGSGMSNKKLYLILGGALGGFLLLAILVVVIVSLTGGGDVTPPPQQRTDAPPAQPPAQPPAKEPPAKGPPAQPPGQPPGQGKPPAQPPAKPPATQQDGNAQRFTQACTTTWKVSAEGCQCLLKAGQNILQDGDYAEIMHVMEAIFAQNQDQIRQRMQAIVQNKGQETAQRIVQALQAMDKDCKNIR